jgi:DNA-binding GntR family transcriptional regulator
MRLEPKPGVQGAALYQRIRNDLEGRIISGAWPPGHRVPFEHELMETYSCSRMTVNKVLSALADAGLLVRRRRAGTLRLPPARTTQARGLGARQGAPRRWRTCDRAGAALPP